MKYYLLIMLVATVQAAWSQQLEELPLYKKADIREKTDWLIEQSSKQAAVYRDGEGNLVLSNGLVSRIFSIKPNGATIGLDNLMNNASLLRSIRPEAELVINGHTFPIGGLVGQTVHNYLLPEWIDDMKRNPSAFQLTGFEAKPTAPRFDWQKRLDWMSKDMPWPTPGIMLTFNYQADDSTINTLAKNSDALEEYAYLKGISVQVHYELYDGLPVFSKWITVENRSEESITINHFKSEILAVTEAESVVDGKKSWLMPNITVDSDYRFGGMSNESVLETSIAWNVDSLYKTQVNYERKMPCLLEAYPKYGPNKELKSGERFNSFRIWELLHKNRDRERKGLAIRKMYRAIAPWATENPILMHVRTADNASVKKAIDQCAEVGFEMVIMTFGSGFNLEDTTAKNIDRMKSLADYAHQKGIALGGYSLLASRKVGGGNDVVMPEGKTPRFGNSPCLESTWGQKYFDQLYSFYQKTGQDILEHDGSYPGDICAATHHPGHKGLADSQWEQFEKISEFYKWCRGKGIYLNVPDHYFLNGSNKTGMGYRETNWSLPRAQQEIIERQNIYDGTWEKTPSMGWMFVPLVQYHGGGAAATIEPLKEHLPHYEQRLANLFGAGVQACYRGPQLYDAPETKAIVKKWVDFYKSHREVLDSDIIHIRRPDGRDYDAILHVNPSGEEKGLLMVYNPLNTAIERVLDINLYYTGLTDKVNIVRQDAKTSSMQIKRDYSIELPVSIPARSQTWFVFK